MSTECSEKDPEKILCNQLERRLRDDHLDGNNNKVWKAKRKYGDRNEAIENGSWRVEVVSGGPDAIDKKIGNIVKS